jgi:hypothetical protein
MTELGTFLAAFGLVFALAFQSLNTNRGHYLAAFITSWVIGGFQLYILKAIPLSETLGVDLAYLAGGPIGAMAAMWLHPKWMKKK